MWLFSKLLYVVKQLIVSFHYYVAIIYTSIITNHVSTNLLSIVSRQAVMIFYWLKPYRRIELNVHFDSPYRFESICLANRLFPALVCGDGGIVRLSFDGFVVFIAWWISRLRSASSLQLDVPRTHRRTVGDRAFAAAGPTLWNSLPHDITDCVSLTSFCRKLLFYIISMTTLFLVVLEFFLLI